MQRTCSSLSCSFTSDSPCWPRKNQVSKAPRSLYSSLSCVTHLRNNQLQENWTNWCDVIACPLLPCIDLSLCDILLLCCIWLLNHQKATAGLKASQRSGTGSGTEQCENQFLLRISGVVLLSPSKITALILISYSPWADLCYEEKKMTEQET